MATTKTIDGKEVRRFLWGRWMVLVQSYQLIEVEAFSKDHSLKRLCDSYPHVERREWDFMDELEPQHFVGKLGITLPLNLLHHGARHE